MLRNVHVIFVEYNVAAGVNIIGRCSASAAWKHSEKKLGYIVYTQFSEFARSAGSHYRTCRRRRVDAWWGKPARPRSEVSSGRPVPVSSLSRALVPLVAGRRRVQFSPSSAPRSVRCVAPPSFRARARGSITPSLIASALRVPVACASSVSLNTAPRLALPVSSVHPSVCSVYTLYAARNRGHRVVEFREPGSVSSAARRAGAPRDAYGAGRAVLVIVGSIVRLSLKRRHCRRHSDCPWTTGTGEMRWVNHWIDIDIAVLHPPRRIISERTDHVIDFAPRWPTACTFVKYIYIYIYIAIGISLADAARTCERTERCSIQCSNSESRARDYWSAVISAPPEPSFRFILGRILGESWIRTDCIYARGKSSQSSTWTIFNGCHLRFSIIRPRNWAGTILPNSGRVREYSGRASCKLERCRNRACSRTEVRVTDLLLGAQSHFASVSQFEMHNSSILESGGLTVFFLSTRWVSG